MSRLSRRHWPLLLWLACCVGRAEAQTGFTIGQALRAPYAVSLSAAPVGARFAWVQVAEGRHTLWIGAPGAPARALTHFDRDDGREIRDVAWFPQGTSLAFTRGAETGADGKPANATHQQPPPEVQVWTVDSAATPADHSEPRLIGAGRAPLPLPDGRHLLLLRGGQIWIADLAATPESPQPGAPHDEAQPNAPVQQLVFDRGSASQLTLSSDGNTLAFISRRDHDHSFLALFDLKTHTLSFPAASTGNDSAPAFSPDGQHLAWLRAPWTDAPEFAVDRNSANPWSIQELELATGRVHTVFSPVANQPGSVLPHVSTGEPRLWWAEADQLVFSSEADGWMHLYALDPTQPTPTPRLLTPGSFEVEDPALSADRTRLVYAANAPITPEDTDRRHLYTVNLTSSSSKPQPLTRGDGLETHPVFAADGTSVAALEAGVRSPSQVATIKAATMQAGSTAGSVMTPLDSAAEFSPSPGTPQAQFVTPQPVLFPSADKLFTLHGQLFLPPGGSGGANQAARHPALLFFHGGPRRQMLLGYPAMEYYARAYALNQYFASRGFIVLSVNYRRGIGYGLDFREAAHSGADGASEYNDLLGALATLRARPDVDPVRIGLWGGSYGGYLTALGLARNSDLLAAGVDFHGVHDWILEDNRADWLRGTAAEQAAIAERAHASSPLADIDHWKSPVLLIHGDNDANVAYAQTPILADALRARNIPTEELIFPDEIHEFLLHSDWLKAYKATAEFLERHLKP